MQSMPIPRPSFVKFKQMTRALLGNLSGNVGGRVKDPDINTLAYLDCSLAYLRSGALA